MTSKRLFYKHYYALFFYRDKFKSSNIQSKLEDSITTKHILHASLGKTEFFEFALKNPSNKEQVVFIKANDKELK